MSDRSFPSNHTRPRSGRSRPASRFSSVDLPTPDSPIMARYSPRSSSRFKPSKIGGRSPPKRLLRFSSRTTALSASMPLRSSGVDADHGLDLQEVAQPEFSVFAPVARHLEAAKRGFHVARGSVQCHLTRSDTACHAPRPDIVLRPHVGGEAVWSIVGDLHGLLLGLVRQNAQHRPEDFLAGNRHVVAYAGKDRRPHEK